MADYKIYPKQFLYDKVLIEKNRCFVIMPFSRDYQEIYGTIKDELGRIGISCFRADEIKGSKPIMTKIISEILRSRFIIADLSECNANVFYELGIAHSFRDARNILLLKQKKSKYPFDLSHLPYTEYDPGNPFSLRATVSSFINDSKYASDFIDTLFLHGISSNTVDGKNNYIEYTQSYFEASISKYTDILNEDSTVTPENEEDALRDFERFVKQTLVSGNREIVEGVIEIYILLLSSCNDPAVIRKYASRFADEIITGNSAFEDEAVSWEMDLMIALAQNNKCLDFCMPWIIHYFSRSKASNIDLSRYKLERFLVETANPKIDDMIISAIYDPDCHVREHMADIIGEKKLKRGYKTLLAQLNAEENYFTIGSITEAIGKVAPQDEGLDAIEDWIDSHGKEIIKENQSYVLKHLYHGIARLDDENNTHGKAFLRNFGPYFKENKAGPVD